MIIDYYKFGEISVDGEIYQKDIILLPGLVMSNWRRGKGHFLKFEDIPAEVLLKLPACVIIGTGKFGLMNIDDELKFHLQKQGVEDLIIQKTATAVLTFNQLDNDEKACFFHLTC